MITVDEKALQWSKDLTIAQLLKTLDNVKFCSVVRLNGRLVSSPKFAETNIPDNSKMTVCSHR